MSHSGFNASFDRGMGLPEISVPAPKDPEMVPKNPLQELEKRVVNNADAQDVIHRVLQALKTEEKELLGRLNIKRIIDWAKKEWAEGFWKFENCAIKVSSSSSPEMVIQVEDIRQLAKGDGEPSFSRIFVVSGTTKKGGWVSFYFSIVPLFLPERVEEVRSDTRGVCHDSWHNDQAGVFPD
jgi:hypothetical protein